MATLLRPDATFIDDATKRAERIFPRGTEWLRFQSQFPVAEVFENSVLDSAIGVAGDLGVRVFAVADWHNWVSSMKISLYEVGTRLGLPALEGTSLNSGLASAYDNLSASASIIAGNQDPAELVPELLKNAGLQVVQLLSGQSSMIAQTVAQVLAAAVWAFDVVAAHRESELGKHLPLPPMQSEDPATDGWQVNRVFETLRSRGIGGIVYPDGKIEPASNADYTSFFLPAYQSTQRWTLQNRETGFAAQQGHAREARGPGGVTSYNFDPGDASTFGFMPGTGTTLRVLQASHRLYHTVRGTPVNRYTVRCRGVDKDCYKTVKAFDGSRDCRQCVDPESVWPVQGIGWAYAGAPLNATTPGENVGEFYPSLNKLLLNLLNQITQPSALLYTVSVDEMELQWKQTFEQFWTFAEGEWGRYTGSGWRGIISRIATLMTAFEDRKGNLVVGGRHHEMPLKLIANPRGRSFEIPFSASIFERIIRPYCRGLARLQRHYLDTVSVAYIPPGAGALYRASGKLRGNKLSDAYMSARKNLLSANKRVLVDLRQVTDPEYYAELKAAGVKPSPVNSRLHGSPGIGDGAEILKPKPARRPEGPPRPVLSATLASSHVLLQGARGGQPPRKPGWPPLRKPGGVPSRKPATPSTTEVAGARRRNWIAAGSAVAAVAATSATAYGLNKLADDEDS